MRESKLWTVDLKSREFSGPWVEGEEEKKAVVCLSVIWSPKRSAVVTHATSTCTCAKHSYSVLKNVGRVMCVLYQKFLSPAEFVWATWWSLMLLDSVWHSEWPDAFVLSVPGPEFEVCSFERWKMVCPVTTSYTTLTSLSASWQSFWCLISLAICNHHKGHF